MVNVSYIKITKTEEKQKWDVPQIENKVTLYLNKRGQFCLESVAGGKDCLGVIERRGVSVLQRQ